MAFSPSMILLFRVSINSEVQKYSRGNFRKTFLVLVVFPSVQYATPSYEAVFGGGAVHSYCVYYLSTHHWVAGSSSDCQWQYWTKYPVQVTLGLQ